MASMKPFWTLSFSGAGHLLPYHLGAAGIMLSRTLGFPEIRAVAGSSSGAIAAAIMTLLPHRLDEYTERFLQDRGYAMRNLKEMLEDEESKSKAYSGTTLQESSQLLVVCTTKSSDGSMHLFTFDTNEVTRNDTKLIRAIQASCMIPKSFHPIDVFSSSTLSYPDGIEIDGSQYVDGGIVAPAPPTPLDKNPSCSENIVVSPISGSSGHIRPVDHSFRLPGELTGRCGKFKIRPSIQNLRAMITSMGVASPELLKEWYDRGADDAEIFLNDWKQHNSI